MMKMKGWFEEKDYIWFVDLKFKRKIWLKVLFFFLRCVMVEKNYPKKRFLLHQQEDKIRICCLFLQKKHSRNLQKIKITKYFRRRFEVKSGFFLAEIWLGFWHL